ncbi:MAG: hypothetical protein C4527_16000 [Candidatus Omnitrophota bacterium]|jgi:cytochrome c oxidase assembly protein subunit 15|nr:MAG: hypothetical protein C4527_16000 [Candidatus Omnitrophota bacterium]
MILDNLHKKQSEFSDLLVIAFGVTVAMWTIGYLCRLPILTIPSHVLFILMILCILAGGFICGRYTQRGLQTQIAIAGMISLLNLLILGSLLSGDNPNQIVPSALLWIPGSFLVTVALISVGAVLGNRAPYSGQSAINWTGLFALVACAATFVLLAIGGLVTSYDAGLAVVDWPNSFGYNMFLYPLSRMTGGIYFEHAHRLFGSLVGLTTMVLAVHLQRTEERKWLRKLAWLALVLVIIQGILGGLRVTGRFTLSTEATEPNILLAIIHGVVGQLFFGILVAISVFLTTTWRSNQPAEERKTASTERGLAAILVSLIVIQLVFGAILRHLAHGLLIHITIAIIVMSVAITCGVRTWGLYETIPVLKRFGFLLLILTGLQILLGIAALIATGVTSASPPTLFSAMTTTAHQSVGAFLLACSVGLSLWTFRLIK